MKMFLLGLIAGVCLLYAAQYFQASRSQQTAAEIINKPAQIGPW